MQGMPDPGEWMQVKSDHRYILVPAIGVPTGPPRSREGVRKGKTRNAITVRRS